MWHVEDYLEPLVEAWCGLGWQQMQRAPAKSPPARLRQRAATSPARRLCELFERCNQLPPPPLRNWVNAMPTLEWIAQLGSGQSTWALLQRRASKSKDGEVKLQRNIVQANAGRWWAEIPTVSGFNVEGSGRQSVDLVEQLGNGQYRLVELKVSSGTNNPISATVELIKYALFYTAIRENQTCRRHLDGSSQALLNACSIRFAVIAPKEYFSASFPESLDKLRRFGGAVSESFESLGDSLGMSMAFEFRSFEDRDSVASFLASQPL